MTKEPTSPADVAMDVAQKVEPSDSRATIGPMSDDAQVAENYIEIYHAISEWIRFADAKAAVLLTVGGALAGFLVPLFGKVVRNSETHLLPYWGLVVTALFILYIATFAWSAILAFLCINPITERGRHPALDHCHHFHPASISTHYSKDQVKGFQQACRDLTPDALRQEIQAGILIDSHICARKYQRVARSLRLFGISAGLGFLFFLACQF